MNVLFDVYILFLEMQTRFQRDFPHSPDPALTPPILPGSRTIYIVRELSPYIIFTVVYLFGHCQYASYACLNFFCFQYVCVAQFYSKLYQIQVQQKVDSRASLVDLNERKQCERVRKGALDLSLDLCSTACVREHNSEVWLPGLNPVLSSQ